jgi:hypothetical protein
MATAGEVHRAADPGFLAAVAITDPDLGLRTTAILYLYDREALMNVLANSHYYDACYVSARMLLSRFGEDVTDHLPADMDSTTRELRIEPYLWEVMASSVATQTASDRVIIDPILSKVFDVGSGDRLLALLRGRQSGLLRLTIKQWLLVRRAVYYRMEMARLDLKGLEDVYKRLTAILKLLGPLFLREPGGNNQKKMHMD